jgi:Trk-type K+ transport system membrane component
MLEFFGSDGKSTGGTVTLDKFVVPPSNILMILLIIVAVLVVLCICVGVVMKLKNKGGDDYQGSYVVADDAATANGDLNDSTL